MPTGVALAQAQVEANAAIRSKLILTAQWQVAALLREFKGWYDDKAVRALGAQVASVVHSAQSSMTAAQNAYLSWSIQSRTGVAPVAPLVQVTDLRSGVSTPDVYSRLGEQYRYSKSINDNDDNLALQATVNRANRMIDTDVALAARKQSQATFEASKQVIGYRRVIHPEKSRETGVCGMCLVASDRIYRKKDLLPIHPGCNCEVAEITKDNDPGSALNNLSLSDLYDDAKGDQIFDLVRTRYKVEHHDELGPQMVPVKTGAKGWYEGMSPDQIQKIRDSIAEREGNDKIRRDMDARLAAMQRDAKRAARRSGGATSTVKPKQYEPAAGDPFADKSRQWLDHQISVESKLPDTPRNRSQLQKLRQALASR